MKFLKTFEQNSLKILNLSYNNLTSLPELPDSLEELFCDNNQLTSLPKLPKSLKKIICTYNQLTSLPELPDSLKELYCEGNQLPYTNLDEYISWHIETYPTGKYAVRKDAEEYNL